MSREFENVDFTLINKILKYLSNGNKKYNDIIFIFNSLGYSKYSIDRTIKLMWHHGLITNKGNIWAKIFPILNSKNFDENHILELTMRGRTYHQ